MKKVAIIMGSDSDLPILEESFSIFSEFDVPFEVHIFSAHRTPDLVYQFASNAKNKGFGVILAAAGMSAHLAGFIASQTTLPVIGIPIKSSVLEGIDALLSTVQMPPGIPVATVSINGAVNAAILAVQILAETDIELDEKLNVSREKMAKKVLIKDQALQDQMKKK